MDQRLLLLAAPEFLTFLASLLIGVVAWRRRRSTPGLAAFPLISLGVALWTLGGVLAKASQAAGLQGLPGNAAFWLRLSTLGIDLLPLAWLAFVVQYCRSPIRLPWPAWALLALPPLLSQALVWSGRSGSGGGDGSGALQALAWAANAGLWKWLHVFYAMAVILLGGVLLANHLLSAAPVFRKRSRRLLLAILAPMLVYLVELSGLQILAFSDLTPLAFVLFQAAFLVSLTYQNDRQILPLAHDLLVNRLQNGMLVLDPDGLIVEINPAAVEISGLPAAQVSGRLFTAIFPEMAALLDQARSLTPAQAYVTRGAGKERRYYQVQISPLVIGKAGLARSQETCQYAGGLVLVVDITARRQAEQALKESDERYQAIFQDSQLGILIQNEFGSIQSCNPAAQEILGLGIEQIGGRTFSDPRWRSQRPDGTPLPADEHPSSLALNSGEPQTGCVLGIQRPNGETRWLKVNSLPVIKDENRRPALLVNTLMDITQARLAEQTACTSDRLYKTLMMNAPLPLVIGDGSGNILAANALFERLFARQPSEILGQPMAGLFSGGSQESCRRELQGLLESSSLSGRTLELSAARPNGGEFPVSATFMPIPQADGRLVAAFITDLSELRLQAANRRQAEEGLHQAEYALELRARELVLLSELTELLENAASAREAYAVISEYSARLFPQASGALYLMNGKLNLFENQVFFGSDPPLELYFSPDMCWGLKRGRPHLGAAAENGLSCRHTGGEAGSHFTEYICVPMQSQGDVIGLYHLRWGPPTERKHVEYLAVNAARQITLALANLMLNDELRRQSIRDPLTGLFNRQYMEETLERELRRAARYGRPVGVIMLGIDAFKEYSQANGQAAAEALVRATSNYLLSNLRGEDVPCRYDTAVFVLILPDTALEGSQRLGEKIRQGLGSLHMELGGVPVQRISISHGVAAYPHSGLGVAELLAVADELRLATGAKSLDRGTQTVSLN